MTKKKNIQWVKRNGFVSLLGFLFVALFTIAVAVPQSFASSTESEQCERGELACTEKSEVPREWQWKKPNIKFDHMYRSGN